MAQQKHIVDKLRASYPYVDLVFGVEDAAASHLTAEERATLLALGQKLLDACRAETENFLQTTSIGD